MKDSFFEMLLNLFEKTLSEIKENHISDTDVEQENDMVGSEEIMPDVSSLKAEVIQSQAMDSMRVFTYHEQMKLTKASYQFLMRMLVWEVIHPDTIEIIINRLIFSESRIITLEETKWTVRNVLADVLDQDQRAFLDLILYQQEDGYTLH
tara:strand:- start:920 stop:1369 length:450 start_codon:yes stop_codon:yes gene_type:complete